MGEKKPEISAKRKLIDKHIPQSLLKHLKDGKFISVGSVIYKVTVKPDISRRMDFGEKHYYVDFIELPKETVKDMTGNSRYPVDLYQNFNCDYEYPVPCNIQEDYEFVIDSVMWNSYQYPPRSYKEIKDEADLESKCPTTLKLYRHIYSDKLDLGLDLATVEFMNPTQPLPVQVLYSRENNTGKSTILYHRAMLYGRNSAIVDSGTFDDQFNAPVVGKNFIGIDEGKLKEDASLEKLKAMVTNPTIQYRAMRKASITVPNFGKWAIATNKFNWAKLDSKDSRFWVNKVPVIEGGYDKDFEVKLYREVEHWIGFLKKRWELRGQDDVTGLFRMRYPKKESRLWFAEDVYTTHALLETKINSRSINAKTFLDEIIEWFQNYNDGKPEVDQIKKMYVTTKSLRDNLHKLPPAITTPIIKNILEHDLEIQVEMNTTGMAHANKRYTDYFDINKKVIQRSGVYLLDLDYLIDARGGDHTQGDVDFEDVNNDGSGVTNISDLDQYGLPF